MSWVFCTGMIRSGSTLQFQLASSIVEHARVGQRMKYAPESEFETVLVRHIKSHGLKVFKAHVCTPALASAARAENSKVIYCYRDIRDVALSAMRKFNLSFDELIDAGWLDQAITDFRAWTTVQNVLVSRYEEMVLDLEVEVSRLAIFLGLNIEPDELKTLAQQFDIPAQLQRIHALKHKFRKRAKGSDIFFDEVELLHHNHIHKGEIGGWRHYLSAQQKDILTDRYHEWLCSMGYDFE